MLEQVSQLFGDHPDLLDEFAQFLPDGVQEQARERLNRAAKEAEHRKSMQRIQAMAQSNLGKRAAQRDSKAGVAHQGNARKQAAMQQHLIQQQHAVQQAAQRKTQRRRVDEGKTAQYTHISMTAERQFFDMVKDYLTSTSRESWTEFVKVC